MEKYILEELHPVTLSKTRRADSPSLTEEEVVALRSAIHKSSWVGREFRLRSSQYVCIATFTRMFLCLRSTTARPVTLWRMDPMPLTPCVDVRRGWSGLDDDGGTGRLAGMVGRDGDGVLTSRRTAKVSRISKRSAKLKRKVSSKLAGETVALSQAVAEVEWLQVMMRDIMVGDVAVRDKPSSLFRSLHWPHRTVSWRR